MAGIEHWPSHSTLLGLPEGPPLSAATAAGIPEQNAPGSSSGSTPPAAGWGVAQTQSSGGGGDLAATLGGLASFGHSRAKCPALPRREQATAGPTRPWAGRSRERGGWGPNCSIRIPSIRTNSCCKSLLVAHSPTAGRGGVLGRGALSVSSPCLICRKETVQDPWIAL